MAYSIFMDGVQMPVTPSKISTKINNKNKTITLINDGEVNIIKTPGLTDVDFEVLIPQVKYPFAVYEDKFKPAQFYIEKFEQLKLSSSPFQFKVNRTSPKGDFLYDTNLTVTLEDYEISENTDNGLDLMVSIKLKQYREYKTKIINISSNTSEDTNIADASVNSARESTRSVPGTYTVQEGDTLWGIAKANYGDGSKYNEIAELNGISNPNLIYVGQVIKLAEY